MRIADRENSNPWVQERAAKTVDKNTRHVATRPTRIVPTKPASANGTIGSRNPPLNRAVTKRQRVHEGVFYYLKGPADNPELIKLVCLVQ